MPFVGESGSADAGTGSSKQWVRAGPLAGGWFQCALTFNLACQGRLPLRPLGGAYVRPTIFDSGAHP